MVKEAATRRKIPPETIKNEAVHATHVQRWKRQPANTWAAFGIHVWIITLCQHRSKINPRLGDFKGPVYGLLDYRIRTWITRLPSYWIRASINHGWEGPVYAALNHGIPWFLRRKHLLASAEKGISSFCGSRKLTPSKDGRHCFLPRGSYCFFPPCEAVASFGERSNCLIPRKEVVASFRG